jgi:hypothetical protein
VAFSGCQGGNSYAADDFLGGDGLVRGVVDEEVVCSGGSVSIVGYGSEGRQNIPAVDGCGSKLAEDSTRFA